MKDGCPNQLMHGFFEAMDKIAEERQEACIHCGKVWYVIHHKDGVCRRCQQEGKPCRTALEQRRKQHCGIMFVASIASVTGMILYFLKFL